MAQSFGNSTKQLPIQFEKEGRLFSLEEFEKLVGFTWFEGLDFDNFLFLHQIIKKTEKLHKKEKLSLEQVWLGRYFSQEIQQNKAPDLTIRWIDSDIGWGVFAARDLRKNTFIAQYSGKVRKRVKSDQKNSYCFEYLYAHGIRSPYNIDAKDMGGVARFINHQKEANCSSSLATIDHINHVVIFTKTFIAKGEQLCYDYGPDYWAKRASPSLL